MQQSKNLNKFAQQVIPAIAPVVATAGDHDSVPHHYKI